MSVFNEDPKLDALVRSAATKLHLKPHSGVHNNIATQSARSVCGKQLSTAGDVQGHLGFDRRYHLFVSFVPWPPVLPAFCQHFHRAFPPEAATATTHLPQVDSSVFFRFLRPEFLQRCKELNLPPLSSDAWSLWGGVGAQARLNNNDVRKATDCLLKDVIPACAMFLDEKYGTASLSCVGFRDIMHAFGVNMRHSSLVRSSVKSPAVRAVIVIDMVQRTLKNLLRNQLRLLVLHSGAGDVVRSAACDFMRTAAKDKTFWWKKLPPEVEKRFGSLALEFLPEDLMTACKPALPTIIDYILAAVGMRLAPHARSKPVGTLEPTDVDFAEPRIKHVFETEASIKQLQGAT